MTWLWFLWFVVVIGCPLPPPPTYAGCIPDHSFCLVAYMWNLLPYLGVTRQAFIYHYMPGLHYASLLSAVCWPLPFFSTSLFLVAKAPLLGLPHPTPTPSL